MQQEKSYPALAMSLSFYTPSNPGPPAEALICSVLAHGNKADIIACLAFYGVGRISEVVRWLDGQDLSAGWGMHQRGAWAAKSGALMRRMVYDILGAACPPSDDE